MRLVYVFASGTLILSSLANAELKFNSDVTSSYVRHSSDSEAFSRRDSDIFTFEPSLGATYEANKIQGAATVRYLQVSNNASSDSTDLNLDQNYNFTSFNYNGRLTAIDNVLSFTARGSQSYRNTIAGNALVNDELYGSQELSKTQTNSAGFNFSLSQGDWVRMAVEGSYSKVKSDRQVFLDSDLDTSNTSVTSQIYSGDEVKRVNWNISGTYNETLGSGFNDSRSELYSGDFRIGLINEFSLVFTGQNERNELSSESGGSDVSSDFNYTSYGVGLSWYQSAQRFIDVTYNRSTENEDESENFLGLKFDWRFTSRTSIAGEYGRRFYGESGNLNLTHKIRKFQTQVTYEENITNYTRLVAGDTVTGSFVCPIGADQILQCFQPATIDYVLQPGEEFSNFNFIIPDITESDIIRKSLSTNIGYSFRKVQSSLTYRNTNTEYIDGSREQKTQTISLDSSLQINRKTSLSGSIIITSYDNTVDDDRLSADNDDVFTATLNYTRKLNRDLNATIGYQHTTRRSPVENRDYDSDRITFEVVYTLF
ncbi:MAG: hypothetical protein ABJV04_07365 [Aliiglaciecola sp.]|uniref:hypothetical protein n=1 Tax=Aliiglaciecola sp. TaxID=1872441 RepID=UPI003299F603